MFLPGTCFDEACNKSKEPVAKDSELVDEDRIEYVVRCIAILLILVLSFGTIVITADARRTLRYSSYLLH